MKGTWERQLVPSIYFDDCMSDQWVYTDDDLMIQIFVEPASSCCPITAYRYHSQVPIASIGLPRGSNSLTEDGLMKLKQYAYNEVVGILKRHHSAWLGKLSSIDDAAK